MIYFTADLHFYHDKIIKHTGRPFHNSDEMDRVLIHNWNNAIKPDDEVYILNKEPCHNSRDAENQTKQRKYDKNVDASNLTWYDLEWLNQKLMEEGYVRAGRKI